MNLNLATREEVGFLAKECRNVNQLFDLLLKKGFTYIQINQKVLKLSKGSQMNNLLKEFIPKAVIVREVISASDDISMRNIFARLEAIEKKLSFPVTADVSKVRKSKTIDYTGIDRAFEKQRITQWMTMKKGTFKYNDIMTELGYANTINGKKRAAYCSLVNGVLGTLQKLGKLEVVGSTMIMGYGKKQRKINIYEAVRL